MWLNSVSRNHCVSVPQFMSEKNIDIHTDAV